MPNPIANAFRHLVATQRDRYERAHGFHQFRCHRMTASDSGPDNNESGERQREPINTTALAEQKVEYRILCPDLKRELDSAQTVEGDSKSSVRPVTRCEGVQRTSNEGRLAIPGSRNLTDAKAQPSRGTIF